MISCFSKYQYCHDIFPDVNRTQPFGSGATCVYNYFDLQVYNGTNEVYQLIVHLTDSSLVGEWRSTKPPLYTYRIYEKDHSFTPNFWGGYTRNNIIHRKVYNIASELVDDEFITENHALMVYEPFLNESNT